MKTTWRILTIPHFLGARFAIWMSGYKIGEERNGKVCVSVEADTFTHDTFLVVAKWKKIDVRAYLILL